MKYLLLALMLVFSFACHSQIGIFATGSYDTIDESYFDLDNAEIGLSVGIRYEGYLSDRNELLIELAYARINNADFARCNWILLTYFNDLSIGGGFYISQQL